MDELDEMERQDMVAEVDWVGEEPRGPEEFWREHLRRQLRRSAVVLLIFLALLGLKEAGSPGRWLLDKISQATRADFSGYLAGFFEQADLNGMAGIVRRWLANEWQVVGPDLRQQNAPPILTWPVKGAHPMTADNLRTGGGLALDLQVTAGSTVLAAAGGVVAEARREQDGGITIVLQHAGDWRTIYGQCGGLLVAVGEKVVQGQSIALVGTSAPPTPTHLHFEVWDRSGQVDPYLYLRPAAAGDELL